MSAIKLSEFCIMIYCLLFKNTHSHTHQTNYDKSFIKNNNIIYEL